MDLDRLLENVNSKASFLVFIKALKEDKIDEDEKEKIQPSSPFSSGANGWEKRKHINFLRRNGSLWN